MSRNIHCIIHHDAGEHERPAPVEVNGRKHPIKFNERMTLAEEAFEALKNSTYKVERLADEKKASPAGNGGGDGAASGPGGANGGAASPRGHHPRPPKAPKPPKEPKEPKPPKAPREPKPHGQPKPDPLDHDADGVRGGSLRGSESTRSKGAKRKSTPTTAGSTTAKVTKPDVEKGGANGAG